MWITVIIHALICGLSPPNHADPRFILLASGMTKRTWPRNENVRAKITSSRPAAVINSSIKMRKLGASAQSMRSTQPAMMHNFQYNSMMGLVKCSGKIKQYRIDRGRKKREGRDAEEG
jgi:hypothetical protein